MAPKIWECWLEVPSLTRKAIPETSFEGLPTFEDVLLAGMLGFLVIGICQVSLEEEIETIYNCEIQVKKMGGCIKIPMKTVGLSTAGCHWNTPPFQVDWVSQAGLKPHVLATKQEIFGWWKLEGISKVITPLIGVKSPQLLYHLQRLYINGIYNSFPTSRGPFCMMRLICFGFGISVQPSKIYCSKMLKYRFCIFTPALSVFNLSI